jgi:hypothetical protein
MLKKAKNLITFLDCCRYNFCVLLIDRPYPSVFAEKVPALLWHTNTLSEQAIPDADRFARSHNTTGKSQLDYSCKFRALGIYYWILSITNTFSSNILFTFFFPIC